jgi:hypothetical protein
VAMIDSKISANPPLDRWRVDGILEPDRKLWGLPMIAAALGVSVGTARKLAGKPEVPIYRPEGSDSYFAFLSELRAWLRSKPSPENG